MTAFQLHYSFSNDCYVVYMYTVGTSFVSVIYLIGSLLSRYDNRGSGSADWYTSFTMLIRTAVVVFVAVLEDRRKLVEDFEQRVAEVCLIVVFSFYTIYKLLCPCMQESLQLQKTFVRLISHELRSPLNAACLGLNQIINDVGSRVEDKDHVDALEDILRSCEFSVGILDDLLSAELLGKGIMQLNKTTVSAFSFILDNITPFIITVLCVN